MKIELPVRDRNLWIEHPYTKSLVPVLERELEKAMDEVLRWAAASPDPNVLKAHGAYLLVKAALELVTEKVMEENGPRGPGTK